MTPKELAEKIFEIASTAWHGKVPSDCKVQIESLLQEALDEQRKNYRGAIDIVFAHTRQEREEAVDEAKAAAYEECAKIADPNADWKDCDCAIKIRKLAKKEDK